MKMSLLHLSKDFICKYFWQLKWTERDKDRMLYQRNLAEGNEAETVARGVEIHHLCGQNSLQDHKSLTISSLGEATYPMYSNQPSSQLRR